MRLLRFLMIPGLVLKSLVLRSECGQMKRTVGATMVGVGIPLEADQADCLQKGQEQL